MMEQLIDCEVAGESQVKEIRLIREDNMHYVVYLVGHDEIKRTPVGFQYGPAYAAYATLKRDWRQKCPP